MNPGEESGRGVPERNPGRKQPALARSSEEQPGAARSRQEQPEASRTSQEQTVIYSQEQPGAAARNH